MWLAGFEDTGRGPCAKESRQTLELKRLENEGSSLELSGSNAPRQQLGIGSVRSRSDF